MHLVVLSIRTSSKGWHSIPWHPRGTKHSISKQTYPRRRASQQFWTYNSATASSRLDGCMYKSLTSNGRSTTQLPWRRTATGEWGGSMPDQSACGLSSRIWIHPPFLREGPCDTPLATCTAANRGLDLLLRQTPAFRYLYFDRRTNMRWCLFWVRAFYRGVGMP